MPKTPIAVFTYKRPVHTQQMLASLAGCARLDECQITIFCDGAKRPEDETEIQQSRHVVRQWAEQFHAEVVERSDNLGLAKSVVSGVTDLCDKHGRVIVIEDDLILAPGFLNFMLQGLDRYQDMPQVYQISGYIYPAVYASKYDAAFLPLISTWGWATWQRAWADFQWNPVGTDERLQDPQIRSAFSADGSYPFAEMLEERLQHKNDSWGILWAWSVFQQGGLTLWPRKSFVYVGGADGTGTHVPQIDQWAFQGDMKAVAKTRSTKLALPSTIAIDPIAYNAVKAFLREPVAPGSRKKRSMWQRLQKRIGWISRAVRERIS